MSLENLQELLLQYKLSINNVTTKHVAKTRYVEAENPLPCSMGKLRSAARNRVFLEWDQPQHQP